MRSLALAVVLVLAPSLASAQSLGAVGAAVHGQGGGGVALGLVPAVAVPARARSATEATLSASPYSPTPRRRAPVIGVVDLQAAYLVDRIARAIVAARVRVVGVIDFEARYDLFAQRSGRDDVGAIGFARLGLSVNTFGGPYGQVRTGLAALVYHDGDGVSGGGLASLEIDVLPIAPLVIRYDLGLGPIGTAFAVESRITLGLQIDRTELAIGYSVFYVTPIAPSSLEVTLHGPMAGVRVSIY